MKTKLLITAMLVMGLSLGVNNTVSAQRHGGRFGFGRGVARILIPPIPRVILPVPAPVVSYGYGYDYPVYRRPAPRYYQGGYYGGAYYGNRGYYRDGYENRGRGYDRDGYRGRGNERRGYNERSEHYGPRNNPRGY